MDCLGMGMVHWHMKQMIRIPPSIGLADADSLLSLSSNETHGHVLGLKTLAADTGSALLFWNWAMKKPWLFSVFLGIILHIQMGINN